MLRTPLRPTAALLFALSATPLGAAEGGQAATDAAYAAGYRDALEAVRAAQAAGHAIDTLAPPASAPATVAASVAAPPAATADSGPREWWNHSSLRQPLQLHDDAWRHAAQAQLSFSSLSGNDDGNAWRGNGKLHSRLGRWTNELSLTLDKRNIKSANGALNSRDYRMLQESLRYDLTDRWYTAGGFILERDDVSLVDRRVTALAGAGYYWLDNERFRLNTYLAMGRVDERYMDYVRDHVEVDQRASGLLYLYQTFSWQLSENLSLRQGFRLMQDLKRSGHYVFDPVASTPPSADNPQGFERYRAANWVKRYRTITAVDLDYRLGPRSSASLGFENRYDSNPWPDVIRRDIVKRLSLNIQF